jgi:hypothetical protein
LSAGVRVADAIASVAGEEVSPEVTSVAGKAVSEGEAQAVSNSTLSNSDHRIPVAAGLSVGTKSFSSFFTDRVISF